jgi:hypothetical protein
MSGNNNSSLSCSFYFCVGKVICCIFEHPVPLALVLQLVPVELKGMAVLVGSSLEVHEYPHHGVDNLIGDLDLHWASGGGATATIPSHTIAMDKFCVYELDDHILFQRVALAEELDERLGHGSGIAYDGDHLTPFPLVH